MLRSLENRAVLITGGAGFLGSHFLDHLIDTSRARDIVVVDNFFLGSLENLDEARGTAPNTRVIRADSRNFQTMESIVRENDIEVVFDFATIPLPASLSFPVWTLENNIETTVTLCELARKNLIESFVHISSSEAYGTALTNPMSESHPFVPSTPYAASKASEDLIIRSYIQTYGIQSLIIRPFNNYGPRQNLESYAGVIPIFIGAYKRMEPLRVYGDGLQTRDFIFVRDTARYVHNLYCKVEKIEGTYNLGSGIETSVLELGALIGNLLGVEPLFEFLPARPGDVRRHCADITLLNSVLEQGPPAINTESMAETIDFFWERF